MTARGPSLHDYPFIGEPPQPPPPQPPRKRWYQRWPAWIGIGVIAVIVTALIAGLAGGGGSKADAQPANPPSQSTEPPLAYNIPYDVPTPDPTPTPTPEPKREYAAKFGVPYEVSGTDSTTDAPISATYTIASPVHDASFFDGMEQPKAGQFVSFSVALVAATDGVDYNEWNWYVRTGNGSHVDPASWKDPSLGSGTAHAGEKVTGYVTFDAPVHGTLVYAPSGEAIGEWPY